MNKKRVILSLFLSLVVSLAVADSVFANAGGQPGGGGVAGCPGTLCTSWGATWRYYEWDVEAPGIVWGPEGVDGKATSVTIKGYTGGSNSNRYAAGVSNNSDLNDCKNYNGFWRYAMVAYKGGSYDDGTRYSAGDQVGVIGIDGNWSSTFNSQWVSPSGGMLYIGDKSEWDHVRQEFNGMPQEQKMGYEWGSGDGLAWFCYDEYKQGSSSPVTFYSASQSSNRATIIADDDNPWEHTDIKSATDSDRSVRSSLSLILEDGRTDVAHLTFSHNIYASNPNTDIPYTIRRTWKKEDGGVIHSGFDRSNSYYTLDAPSASDTSSGLHLTSQSTDASTSGVARSSSGKADNTEFYSGGERNYTDSNSEVFRYILRDYYEVIFKETGKYFFTETVYIDGVEMTSATTVITVKTRTDPEGDLNQCELWTPSSYRSGVTTVISKVKNSTLDEGWQDYTYAKPNDSIDWIHCYYPGVQFRYDDLVSESDPGHEWCSKTTNSYEYVSEHIRWDNKFTVSQSEIKEHTGLPHTESFGTGDYTIRMFNDTRFARTKQAGDKLVETIETGRPADIDLDYISSHTTSCESCSTDEEGNETCVRTHPPAHTNDYIKVSGSSSTADDSAEARVPYNFNNEVHLKILDNYAYSGESVTLRASGTYTVVGTRWNELLDGNYATEVDNAVVKVITYVRSSYDSGVARPDYSGSLCGAVQSIRCDDSFSETGIDLNVNGNMSGERKTATMLTSHSYNVFDYEAGYYFCMRAAINPYTVDGDHDMDEDGSGTWYISEPDCRVIAKRPTFQVYGGSLYSSGKVTTSTAVKANLGSSYTVTSKSNTRVFGSWVEESTLALGAIDGLASGAANGIKEGGDKYCGYRVPISFANYSVSGGGISRITGMCNGGNTGFTGRMSNTAKTTLNPKSIVDYWIGAKTAHVNENASVDITDSNGYKIADKNIGKAVRYTYGTGNFTITAGSSIGNGVSHIVWSDKSITIASNITYDRTSAHTSIDDIPKLIIYAAGDINILCSVSRIDAIILAGGEVRTCSNSNNYNDRGHSNQLTVNGMIISGYLRLDRTYGGGAGETASKTPAEIINYDTSTLLWGKVKTNSDSSNNNFTITYQHELAPRY